MLDFGWSEFFLIILLAIVLMGPKDIPEIIYNFGRIVRRIQYLKFALSRQFDGFMENMDMHDLKRGGGLADLSPRNIARNMMTPDAPASAPAPTAPPADTHPQSEIDDDEAYYAEHLLTEDHDDTPATKQHQSAG